MADYWVFINYGSEGWKPHQGKPYPTFSYAMKAREDAMGMGNSEVKIFKEVEWTTAEVTSQETKKDG